MDDAVANKLSRPPGQATGQSAGCQLEQQQQLASERIVGSRRDGGLRSDTCIWSGQKCQASEHAEGSELGQRNSKRKFKLITLGHRTHKQFEYRRPAARQQSEEIIIIRRQIVTARRRRASGQQQQTGRLLSALSVVLLLATSVLVLVQCLDSPANIRRFKSQRQQLSSESHNVVAGGALAAANLTDETITSARSVSPSLGRRVRRTNSQSGNRRNEPAASHSARHSPSAQADAEVVCPTNRLLQSLLPAEYVGSPAANQRLSTARAYCDCSADPLGWQLTCFAGSAARHASALAGVGGPGPPNQLHPAFRDSQVQRQQQQQQQAAGGSGSSVRRVHRSPARWMGEHSELGSLNSSTQADLSPASPANEALDPSVHEGFGEDIAATTLRPERVESQASGQQQQQRRKPPTMNGNRRQPVSSNRMGDQSGSSPTGATGGEQDGLVSLASSSSFTLVRGAGRQNTTRMSEKLIQQQQQQLQQQQASSSSNHLMFQTVPVLFSVKYMRNNMIEIDCDQAAPHYKPAMFQGFNVNEIGSFSFNNCQLPNIPFSVLLHRTRSAPIGSQSAASADQAGSLRASSNLNAAGQAAPSSPPRQQQLASRQRHQNLLRARREAELLGPAGSSRSDSAAGEDEHHQHQSSIRTRSVGSNAAALLPADELIGADDDGADSDNSHDLRAGGSTASQQARATSNSSPTSLAEPKVKSLTVNLNTVVEQRTLISLLTGLDLLEELQLNYVQLNLANFEPDLDAELTTATPTATTLLDGGASNVSGQPVAPSGASISAAPPPTTSSSPLSSGLPSSTQQSSTTTSAAPPTHQLLAASTSQQATTSARQSAAPNTPTSTGRSSAAPATTTPATVLPASPTTTTTTTTSRPAALTTARSRQQTISLFKSPSAAVQPVLTSSSSSTRQTLSSLGAPRGLMIAQATGHPSPAASTQGFQTATAPSAAPPASSMLSMSANSNQQQHQATTTTTSAAAASNQVPSIPLSTVLVAAAANDNINQQRLQQANNLMLPTTTLSAGGGPGQRHSPLTLGGQSAAEASVGGTLVSVNSNGPPNGQSVSYTSSVSPARLPMSSGGQSQLLAASSSSNGPQQQQQQSSSVSFSSSVSVSQSQPIQIPIATAASNAQGMVSSGGRLSQAPSSGWMQTQPTGNSLYLSSPTPPPAGTRLVLLTSNSSGQQQPAPTETGAMQTTASGGGEQATQTASSASPAPWNSMQPITAATTNTNNMNQAGLTAPANAPLAAQQLHSNGFGTRTGGGPVPLSLSLYNNMNSNSQFRTTNGQHGANVGLRGISPSAAGVTTTPTTNQQQQQANNNRRQQQQMAAAQAPGGHQQLPSTPITTTPESTSTQFIAAGGRLTLPSFANQQQQQRRQQQLMQHQMMNQNQQQPSTSNSNLGNSNQRTTTPGEDNFMSLVTLGAGNGESPTPFSSAPSASGSSAELFSNSAFFEPETSLRTTMKMAQPSAQIGGPIGSQRFKRRAALEELELSFGELLPNLRSLKLESFIDLSHLISTGNKDQRGHRGQQPLGTGANNNNQQQPSAGSGGHLRRFRRQFKPSDLPERDEGHMSDSDSEAIVAGNSNGEPLVAEESSVHHNSVMAGSSTSIADGSTTTTEATPGSRNGASFDDGASAVGAQEASDEPGEILLRSSDSSPSASSSSDWTLPPTPTTGRPAVVDPTSEPATTAPSSASAEESSNGAIGDPQQAVGSGSSSTASAARLRHFSLLLVKIFSKLNKLRVLQLSSNDIPFWPDNVLYDSRNSLSRLYLISNNIRLLARNSLANLTELETLDLSSNQLRQLNGDLFRDLSSLRNLRACRNLFRKLPSKLFVQIHHKQQQQSNSSSLLPNHHNPRFTSANRLENVDFSKNRYLSQLSADLFAVAGNNARSPINLAPIVNLNLSNCVFNDQLAGKTPEALFASLPDLVSVSLQGNKLREILQTNGLFGKNNRLQRLDVSNNQLTILGANLFNANASQISELQLHHNHLTQVPEQFLFNLRKLRRLSLAYNRLSQLNAKMFFTNQLIESIDLSHNQLITLNTQQSSMIPFGNGANLRLLNLAYNNLSHFEEDLFDVAWSFYTNLQTLDLSHNRFSNQISMPIFYTIADEMLLNLASNQIQSVSVEALMQHEQILDRYASFESENNHEFGRDRNNNHRSLSQQQNNKVPTVDIRLTNNPIACDCMLEPLISYSRRVAAATNPAIVASIFPQQQNHHQKSNSMSSSPSASLNNDDDNRSADLPVGSRYSVLSESQPSTSANQAGQEGRQPQLFYQFKFNDLYCAKPQNLHRRLLSHISIGDLLCPIRDQRLCPRQCQCHYQSAFRTAIVDCNNRQLTRVPEQLTDAANFVHFNVESSLPSSTASGQQQRQQHQVNATRSIASVDKVIIRLDNNRLRSMDELAKLFTVVSINTNADFPAGTSSGSERSRFARAPLTRQSASNASSRQGGSGASLGEDGSSNQTSPGASEEALLSEDHLAAEPLSRASAQPLTSDGSVSSQQQQSGKKMISPVAIGRNMHATGGRQRSRRLTSEDDESGDPLQGATLSSSNQPSGGGSSSSGSLDSDISTGNHVLSEVSGRSNQGDQGDIGFALNSAPNSMLGEAPTTVSTAVLESAEEFRNKRFPLTCELYLDHNLIESIPQNFLESLDQVRSSSMQSTLMPPQAALPTLMLEPPLHSKLNHLAAPAATAAAALDSMVDPMQAASGSTTSSSALPTDSQADSLVASIGGGDEGDDSESPSSRLFGRQPLAPEKKAALMDAISHNVRLNQRQQQQNARQLSQHQDHRQGKSVSPSLVVLSLRYNAISGIEAKMLHRLSKLIKSSNTKLYLGHNPFNCTDNFASLESQQQKGGSASGEEPPSSSENGIEQQQPHQPGSSRPQLLPASPMGDQLIAASDSSSGAYLESAPDDDDLNSSASSVSAADSTGSSSSSSSSSSRAELAPLDCPVGQLKTWLTRHHSSVGDLDELYCVRMTPELAEKLRLASANSTLAAVGLTRTPRAGPADSTTITTSGPPTDGTKAGAPQKWDHDHPWASSLMLPPGSHVASLSKNGLSWNSELLAASAKLIDVNMYDLCPYSGIQVIDPSAEGLLSASHQQVLVSVAIVFILISLCLLLMLIYFGDTQTILAFVYIHMNPVYSCLRLNESHLDGDKLYDAFVSYSSADRDIVMELIERLEQQDLNAGGLGYSPADGNNGQQQQPKGSAMERSHDTLITEADLLRSPRRAGQGPQQQGTLNRRLNSFQDLSTMSRSTSRIMVSDDEAFGGSALDMNAGRLSPAPAATLGPSNRGKSSPDRPYRLCIHERDWLPGHLISWNIVNSVQNSRRTILVLSKDFIKSVWFQVEFHTAYYQMLEDKIDRLIVIVRGELPPKNELDKNLAFLLTTKTYLTWGEKWFWERLHYALPHRLQPKPSKQALAAKQPVKQHHHHYVPKQPVGAASGGQQQASTKSTTADLSAGGNQQQKPLIMSSIGKDVSNLLLPVQHHSTSGQPMGSSSSSGSSASSSSSSAAANTRSYLSGSSTGNLLGPTGTSGPTTATTTNDLLSTATRTGASTNNTTRLTIGPSESSATTAAGSGSAPSQRQSTTNVSQSTADSGRATTTTLMSGSSLMNSSPKTTTGGGGGVTSILLDGNQQSTTGTTGGPNSKVRAKRQERLQNFVDKSISSHLNLSEL